MKHAPLKQPQTVGVLERAHDSFKRIIKIHTNETWSNWHRYSNHATIIHNTSHHSSIGAKASTVFHERAPTKPMDLRFTLNQKQPIDTKSDYLRDIQDSLMSSYAATKNRIFEGYDKYRSYFNRKAHSKPHKMHENCLRLNPVLLKQNDFSPKSEKLWLSL